MKPKRIDHMTDLECVIEVTMLLDKYFQNDSDKVRLFLHTKNPLLGNVEPMLLLANSKANKLLTIMRDMTGTKVD